MHLTEKQFFAYVNRTLDPTELLQVDDHLAACAACCQKLSSVLQANRGENEAVNSIAWELTAAEEEFHLSFPYLAAYIDRQLEAEEQEVVLSHLEVCSACRAEVEDLQAFQQTLSQPQVKPLQAAATVGSGWRAIGQKLRPRTWWAWPAAASVGVALFVLYSGRQPEPIAQQQPISPVPVIVPSASASPASPVAPPESSPTVLSEEDRAVQRALATGRLEIPADINALRGSSSSLMSGKPEPNTFAIVAPQGTMVESRQPRLQWTAVPGAKQYVVTVSDARYTPVVTSEALTETSWTVPVPLNRNALYLWEVVATTADDQSLKAPALSAPEARFKILSPEALQLVRRARQRYATSPLELGVIYARVGLFAEAARELKRASRQSPIAWRLLQNLQQQLG